MTNPPSNNDGFPKGFSGTGIYCGVKSDAEKFDLSLIVSDRSSVGVGVYSSPLWIIYSTLRLLFSEMICL